LFDLKFYDDKLIKKNEKIILRIYPEYRDEQKINNVFHSYSNLYRNKSIYANNNYKTIKINNQEWTVKNLNVDCFLNGDKIIEAKSAEEWEEAGINQIPAYCYFGNNPSRGIEYGKLYNFFALSDSRNLVPKGWRVPSIDDWNELSLFLGGIRKSETLLKSKTYDWIDNSCGDDIFGFSARPSGLRLEDGVFSPYGCLSQFWSITCVNQRKAFSYCFSGFTDQYSKAKNHGILAVSKQFGCSVRLIKD
jgi:uncharacterized protein (TIGR02145 family)